MGFGEKVKREAIAVALATLYFAAWLCVLILLKKLILAEYQVQFYGLSTALIGALILAKVVLVMEHVPLGSWLRRRAAILDVLARTMLYGFSVLIVLVLEKAFDARHEYGGFGAALGQVFQHRDMPHVWANVICVTGALFWYNAFFVVRRHVGEHALIRMALEPSPAESGTKPGDPNPRGGAKGSPRHP